jgi:hypothetical protein
MTKQKKEKRETVEAKLNHLIGICSNECVGQHYYEVDKAHYFGGVYVICRKCGDVKWKDIK